jgi:integrase
MGRLGTLRRCQIDLRGATKRKQKPRSLTVAEFQKFIVHLGEPFHTMALLCVCFGLRISEALALRWSDVDWLNGKLKVERGIVCQQVDDVKTSESRRSLHITGELLSTLKLWKQSTQFPAQEDWIFASPFQIGRLPWSYDQVWRVYQKAGAQAGIGALGTHVLRHTFRALSRRMVGFGWYFPSSSTKADAPRGHSHNDECLRGHRNR